MHLSLLTSHAYLNTTHLIFHLRIVLLVVWLLSALALLRGRCCAQLCFFGALAVVFFIIVVDTLIFIDRIVLR